MKKKVVAGIAASVLVASIATNVLLEPSDILHSADYLEDHNRQIEEGEMGEYAIEYTEQEKLSVADSLRACIIRLPVAVKTVILLPLWAIGAIPVSIGTGLLSALAPVGSQILGFLLQAAVLVGVFCLVYKLLFPQKKVRELFKKKNLRWLLLGAVTLVMVNFALGQAWTGWPYLRVVLMCVVGFGILYLLWVRLCHKFKGPEKGTVKTKLLLEYGDAGESEEE